MRAAALWASRSLARICASRQNPQQQKRSKKCRCCFCWWGASLKCNIGCIIYEGGERCAADHLFPESSLGTHTRLLHKERERALCSFCVGTISLLARFDFCARMSLPVHQLVLTPTANRYECDLAAVHLRHIRSLSACERGPKNNARAASPGYFLLLWCLS